MSDSPKTLTVDLTTSHFYFSLAFFLINTLVATLLLCAIGFFIGLPISVWQFPSACLISLIFNQQFARDFFGEKKNTQMLTCSGIGLGLLASLIFLSNYFYDISFDGQWYHQETVLQLSNKWNPVRNTLAKPVNEDIGTRTEVWCSGIDNPVNVQPRTGKPEVNLKFLNINHFSKGVEIVETSIYQISNRIETGKAVNGILLSASFFLALSFFYQINQISRLKKWLLAILLACNPIALTQLFSFCVDGVVASSLLSLILTGCLLFRDKNKYFLWLFGSLIVFTCNIKFTSLVFTGMISTGLLITLLIYHKKYQFKRLLFLCLFSAITAICFCGFHPYLTNFIRQGNVFYGIKETKDEMVATTPPRLRNLNRFEILFISLFSHTDSYPANNKTVGEMLKIPFTVNGNELKNANDPEVKFSAFGPFFSGALLIAIPIFFMALASFRRTDIFQYELSILIIISSTILIMPIVWWGRFVPQFWLLPVSVLCMSEWLAFKKNRLLKTALYLVLGLNVAWSTLAIFFNLFISSHIDYQMSQLKALHQPITVEYCPYRSFKSNRVRFSESHIPIIESQVTGPYIDNIVHSNTRFETAVPLPVLPKPFILRWSEKIKAN